MLCFFYKVWQCRILGKILFMGNLILKTKKRFFEGWYFKISDKDCAAAFIPSYHIDKYGKRSVFVQFINNHQSMWFEFKDDLVKLKKPLQIHIGNNIFGLEKISFDCSQQGTRVKAEITFRQPKFLRNDIMGIFKYMPFMECRHKVYFISSEAEGYIEHNGNRMVFDKAIGYLESDSGVSFPNQYLWTQCNGIGDQGEKFSIMLSIADIPYLRRNFLGCICSINYSNKEYRLATYKGAKVISLTENFAKIRQGNYVLIAQRLEENAMSLKAPLYGEMIRQINENVCVKMRYCFLYKDNIIFDIEYPGGFEYFLDTTKDNKQHKSQG